MDRLRAVFVDVHSHVVPSGDDGVATVEDGLDLCREARSRGTVRLFATPHVWPHFPLDQTREERVRAAHGRMAAQATGFGLSLELGFELTPAPPLLDEDPARYRLGSLDAVLMEVPFHGSLALTERLAEHIEDAGLVPVIAHPERAEAVLAEPGLAHGLAERGWLLQLNATSIVGYHGPEAAQIAWRLVEEGSAALVGSDGHRAARPPFLDEAYAAVAARVGEDAARPLFDGTALPLPSADSFDLAQRR